MFVAVSITETVFPWSVKLFVTYTYFPSGVTATPEGPPATGSATVATTLLVAVSITETLLEV